MEHVKENIRIYDCSGKNDSIVSIFASSDVSVNMYINVNSDRFSSVVVYPTDTHATEYQGFNPNYGNDYCYPVSVYDDVQALVYNGNKPEIKINETTKTSPGSNFLIENVFIYSTKVVTLHLLYIFNKPSTMFCFNDNLKIIYQSMPFDTWSTEYFFPALKPQLTDITNFAPSIFTTRNNTKVEINSSSNIEKIIIRDRGLFVPDQTVSFSALTMPIIITPLSSFSNSCIGVGLFLEKSEKMFTMLNSTSNFLTNCGFTVVPVNFFKSAFDLCNMTVYTFTTKIDSQGYKIEKRTESELDNEILLKVDINNSVPSYSFSVVVSDTKYYLLPGYTSRKNQVSLSLPRYEIYESFTTELADLHPRLINM